MKISTWILPLSAYIFFFVGSINQAVGVYQDSYILEWDAPIFVLVLLLLPACFGYEIGKDEAKQ